MEGDRALIPSSSNITISGDVYNGLLNEIERLEGLVKTYESKIDLTIEHSSSRLCIQEIVSTNLVEYGVREYDIASVFDFIYSSDYDGRVVPSFRGNRDIDCPVVKLTTYSDAGAEFKKSFADMLQKQRETLNSDLTYCDFTDELMDKLADAKNKHNNLWSEISKERKIHKKILTEERAKVPQWVINLCNAWG